MMETKDLRRADFLTSVGLILLGGWILSEALGMPMKETYSGVENVWYVSPALFPLVIAAGMLILGSVLILHSIRAGGAKGLLRALSRRRAPLSERSLRVVSMVVLMASFVYVYAPKVDFYLTVALFLQVFISIFYFDDLRLMKRLSLFFCAGTAFFGVLFLTGLDRHITVMFAYAVDVLALLFVVLYAVYCRHEVGDNDEHIRKLRRSLLIALVAPLVLCSAFKYLLLVPLPKEGGVIELMNIVRYSLL